MPRHSLSSCSMVCRQASYSWRVYCTWMSQLSFSRSTTPAFFAAGLPMGARAAARRTRVRCAARARAGKAVGERGEGRCSERLGLVADDCGQGMLSTAGPARRAFL